MAPETRRGKGWVVASVLLLAVVALAALAVIFMKGPSSENVNNASSSEGSTTLISSSVNRELNASIGSVKVFYIVPAAWSFGIYDENFNKVERIEVSKGDVVTIVVLPEPFVPKELHEEVEEEFKNILNDIGVNISVDELEKLHEDAEEEVGEEVYGIKFIPHGFTIEGYEDRVNLLVADGYPKTVTFVADKVGSFDIYCTYYCGWGHQYMKLQDVFVVKP